MYSLTSVPVDKQKLMFNGKMLKVVAARTPPRSPPNARPPNPALTRSCCLALACSCCPAARWLMLTNSFCLSTSINQDQDELKNLKLTSVSPYTFAAHSLACPISNLLSRSALN